MTISIKWLGMKSLPSQMRLGRSIFWTSPPSWMRLGRSTFCTIEKKNHVRYFALYFTKFPREPLSYKGTTSCFNLKMSLSNLEAQFFCSIQTSHNNPIFWVWSEEVSAWLYVNGCSDLHATFETWIEHLHLLGHENPLHWGP